MNYYNYYTEVEDTFIRRRGKSLFLSPLDWALIESWQERGIPLHIVIRAIESVFDVYDKQPAGTRSIKSLFYCREEIEIQYSEWLRSQTGKADEEATAAAPSFSREKVEEHLSRSIETLGRINLTAIKGDIDRAIARLTELKAEMNNDPETVDGSLSDIEKMLDESLRTNWDTRHLNQIERDISTQLKSYKREMEPDAYRKTYDLMLLKRLREEAGIPRLGLFYI